VRAMFMILSFGSGWLPVWPPQSDGPSICCIAKGKSAKAAGHLCAGRNSIDLHTWFKRIIFKQTIIRQPVWTGFRAKNNAHRGRIRWASLWRLAGREEERQSNQVCAWEEECATRIPFAGMIPGQVVQAAAVPREIQSRRSRQYCALQYMSGWHATRAWIRWAIRFIVYRYGFNKMLTMRGCAVGLRQALPPVAILQVSGDCQKTVIFPLRQQKRVI
jgi:hypothetical protein